MMEDLQKTKGDNFVKIGYFEWKADGQILHNFHSLNKEILRKINECLNGNLFHSLESTTHLLIFEDFYQNEMKKLHRGF